MLFPSHLFKVETSELHNNSCDVFLINHIVKGVVLIFWSVYVRVIWIYCSRCASFSQSAPTVEPYRTALNYRLVAVSSIWLHFHKSQIRRARFTFSCAATSLSSSKYSVTYCWVAVSRPHQLRMSSSSSSVELLFSYAVVYRYTHLWFVVSIFWSASIIE